MSSNSTRRGRRLALAGVGLGAALSAALALVPSAASGATITQMAAQGSIVRGSVACSGPFAAEDGDIVAGSGTSFTLNSLNVPIPVAADWELRRADPLNDFFTDGEVLQSQHTDFFTATVQTPSKLVPGNFWVCVSTTSRTPVQYKAFVGNGVPA
ncbi:hypothetical protein MF672_041875 [Actinomadura sp. ATCC 31491]|uniref:Secreted protein n=1 Tax=Actinomadura luzonensis TaxID=2805427 RepID=A0ABT0G869_9ACTN|nr:hypothetical protein [Actinomadura luzonensis]MCK2220306.1 hypothetical protein [Actinomadura luzonensis]